MSTTQQKTPAVTPTDAAAPPSFPEPPPGPPPLTGAVRPGFSPGCTSERCSWGCFGPCPSGRARSPYDCPSIEQCTGPCSSPCQGVTYWAGFQDYEDYHQELRYFQRHLGLSVTAADEPVMTQSADEEEWPGGTFNSRVSCTGDCGTSEDAAPGLSTTLAAQTDAAVDAPASTGTFEVAFPSKTTPDADGTADEPTPTDINIVLERPTIDSLILTDATGTCTLHEHTMADTTADAAHGTLLSIFEGPQSTVVHQVVDAVATDRAEEVPEHGAAGSPVVEGSLILLLLALFRYRTSII